MDSDSYNSLDSREKNRYIYIYIFIIYFIEYKLLFYFLNGRMSK